MSATNISGLSDCGGSIFGESTRCACGSVARVGSGLCVNCLLQGGLMAERTGNESFVEVLAEIDVRDNDWQLGNYQILEEIGRGGMGVIYRARQRHSRRIVALKRVLSYHSDSRETLTRFQREAEAAASLDHPNLLPIYEVALTGDGLPFFSMKFAPGGSLLQAKGGFQGNPRTAVRLLAKVARAVDYAHSQGILHRDLKPGNILLDGRGEPMVSDFGLAKWIEATSDLTRTMTVFGTPGYIAPEQVHCSAQTLTASVDVYSLGAILFELLSGRPPFLAEHAIAVIHQAVDKKAPMLRSIAPTLPRDLETICARCLEREPAARYQSAGVLADDLERWLEGRPIIARPVCAPVQLWRWSKRNPRLAIAVGACAFLGLAVLGRQYQTHRLEKALWDSAAAAHSVAVVPFLDLDGIHPDATIAAGAADLLQRQLSSFGPCRVILVKQPLRHWTGAGLEDETREALRYGKTQFVLSGTSRRIAGNTRLSLHLIGANGSDVVGNWVREIPAEKTDEIAGATADVFGPVYQLLDSKGRSVVNAEDPVMTNERAQKFFVAGRDLISRRTIAELDRAVSCLENALREEPRSIDTRAFLAMAAMGRDTLCTNRQLASRAIQVAREAVQLAPDNPTAHRAACTVIGSYGHYREALEHAFQSIELGDRSERAFGQIAYTWKMLGRPDLAILWYKKAKLSQRQPADYDALMGDCWADLTVDRSAELEYESATSFHPDQPDGWLGLCRLKLLAGDTETARQIYRAQLPRYPDFAVAKEVAAMVEFFGRNFADANKLYTELAQADHLGGGRGQFYGAIDYCSALGRLKMEFNDKIAGRQLLEQSVISSKSQILNAAEDHTVLYRLAAAEASLGETAASLKHLQLAIDAGWIDYRSPKLDPRFDSVSHDPQFHNILSGLAARLATLRQRLPAASRTVNDN